MQRKAALDFDDMVAIATVGAHECLRSGITTIGDCSFSGAAAIAAAATGLRAIVYLEVFGRDAAGARPLPRDRTSASSTVLSDRVRLGVSPHAPYTCTIEVYRACAELGLPAGDPFRRERRRARLARRRARATGARSPSFLVPPPGETGIRLLAAEGLLGPSLMAAHCVHADAEEIALLAAQRRRRRALPPLERLPRLRRRAGRGAARRGRGRLDRDRQPCLDAVARPVRGDPNGDRRPRERAQGGPMRCRRPTRSSSRRSAAPACSGWTIGSARSCPASRPT